MSKADQGRWEIYPFKAVVSILLPLMMPGILVTPSVVLFGTYLLVEGFFSFQ